MRPVNLIPPEERRGEGAPSRTGPLAYVIVGALVVALGVMLAVTVFGNQIDERSAQVAELERKIEVAEARATSLSPYVSLQAVKDARTNTVDTLAKSRFDWERVLRELSRLVPSGVAVYNVTGTVAPSVQVTDAAEVPLRESVPGPALEILGCSPGQRPVAEFVSLLYDIDGVTRVTAESGIRGDTDDEGSTSECAEANASKFQIVAAFDSVPVPESATATTPVDPAATAPPVGATDVASQQAEQQQDINTAAANAEDAAGLAP